MSDPIDREVYIARSGRPHIAAIAHLDVTHSLPSTAHYLYQLAQRGEHDADARLMLAAIAAQRDTNSNSPTFGCLKWFLEDPGINDTNASFFTCLPLALMLLVYREALTDEEAQGVGDVFTAVAPWFAHMADSPSLFYPNKCIADVAMALATGHMLTDETLIARARDFARRWFDYVDRRGMGWGEDHSPVYSRVIAEMALLIMLLEKQGDLYDRARAMVDGLMEWLVFCDGQDAVPSIRGYNFDATREITWEMAQLLAGAPAPAEPNPLTVLATAVGYSYTPQPLTIPRQSRRRTFDAGYSTSYIGPHSRLGTLSHYPLMPDTYQHDAWGLAWQTKPASFIVHGRDYGILQWRTEDDEGVVRRHEAATGPDFASRHLFKRVSFHPEVVFAAHQDGPAAIIFREIHNLHSPTVRLEDFWRLAPGDCRVLVGGKEWDGQRTECPPDWIVLDYGDSAVAIRPLRCRLLDTPDDDPNPQRRLEGNLVDLSLTLQRGERGLELLLPLIAKPAGTITQPLLFTGWAVALLDRAADVASLQISETIADNGEIPRPYGELIRTVELTTPTGQIKLVRDMLTGEEWRYTDGEPVRDTIG